MFVFFFFFKQKTAYDMRISDWSSDVCSSDLPEQGAVTRSTEASLMTVSFEPGALCAQSPIRRRLRMDDAAMSNEEKTPLATRCSSRGTCPLRRSHSSLAREASFARR